MSDRIFTAKAAAKLSVGASPATLQAIGISVPSTLHDIKIIEIGCEPFGVVNTAEKARVQLLFGTSPPDGGTVIAIAPNDKKGALTSKCSAWSTATNGGTSVFGTEQVVWETMVHLQAGYPWRLDHLGIYVPGGTGVILRVINGSTATEVMPRVSWKE